MPCCHVDAMAPETVGEDWVGWGRFQVCFNAPWVTVMACTSAVDETRTPMQTLFGDQPHDVLRGAADEVLAVLKNENLKVLEQAP